MESAMCDYTQLPDESTPSIRNPVIFQAFSHILEVMHKAGDHRFPRVQRVVGRSSVSKSSFSAGYTPQLDYGVRLLVLAGLFVHVL
ncbi:hypothetical protein BDV11DRAFT_187768 [Aspergillus similis]